RHLRRNGAVVRGAEAELADAAIAPGPHRAVLLERDAVVVSGLDLSDAGQHSHRRASCGGRPVTHLAHAVGAPGPHLVLAVQRVAVVTSAGDGDDVAQGHGSRAGATGGAAVALLPEAVVTRG